MQAALRHYSDEVRRTHSLAVHFRIGRNAGEVVVRAISKLEMGGVLWTPLSLPEEQRNESIRD
jgi:hypothetical protein